MQDAKAMFELGNAPYAREAAERVAEVMIKDQIYDRSGINGPRKLRPSMFGSKNGHCVRAHVLNYYKIPQKPWDLFSLEATENGTWTHYQWQFYGLAAGILSDIEVPMTLGAVRGNADGLFAEDNALLEIKSANDRNWQGFAEHGPSWGYKAATHVYMKGLKTLQVYFVFVNSYDYRKVSEQLWEWDTNIWKPVSAILTAADEAIHNRELPPMLEGCKNTVLKKTPRTRQDELLFENNCGFAPHCYQAQVPALDD
jgi:hypothetical protein